MPERDNDRIRCGICKGKCFFKDMDGLCNFIGKTGHARILICRCGEKCIVRADTPARYKEIMRIYTQKKRIFAPEDRSAKEYIPKFDEMKAWKLYEEQRLEDAEIAEQMGVARTTIAKWRYCRGYPTNTANRYGKKADRPPTKPYERQEK